jgi:aryl-alcohol dehydrogenase-like predicted oxidoreductase
MKKILLGKTKLRVSRLCYGTEPFAIPKGPDGMKNQGDVPPQAGGQVLKEALAMGVNFWDTSDDYGTRPHVRAGLSLVNRGDVVVADKSYAMTFEYGRKDLNLCLAELETDYVDLMHLHYVPPKTIKRQNEEGQISERGSLQSRMGALKAFLEAKESGEIRSVGLTTHSTGVLREVLEVPEIEVVCTTLNKVGGYVEDGSLEEHVEAIRAVKEAGKGVYVIKILHGGRLRDEAESAIRYALQFHEFIDVWNIGMYNTNDLQRNLQLLEEVVGS